MAGLYIHIPFCHSKCAYCDFFSIPRIDCAEEYIDTLLLEYQRRRQEIHEPFTTLYIGGGTPSSLPLRLLDRLLTALPLQNLKEVTIEVNPEDVSDKFASWLAISPITRVSMGVQSLDDEELSLIGRRHSSVQTVEAFARLRAAGIDNISLDLIFGLPAQTPESWLRSLQGVIGLHPEHLSAYTLMLEPGTRLHAMAQTGRFTPADDEDIQQMYRDLCTESHNAGYEHYEISNFALPGFRSRHNSSYWDMTPYLGLGTGAHSFDGTVRRFNPPDIRRYINSEGQIEQIDPEYRVQRINDLIMTRLRTAEGLDTSQIHEILTPPEFKTFSKEYARHLKNGNLRQEENRIIIPEERFLIADSIIVDLILDCD